MATRDQSTGRTAAEAAGRAAARAPDGTRVYAIGDIHGRADLLAGLHRRILDDAADAPSLRRVVVYLGDYVDRGPDSAGVVEMLLDTPLEGFERHCLKGNHEDFLLRFRDGDDVGETWMINGGNRTLESYGLGPQDMFPDPAALADARRAFRDALPERHLAFFRGLDLHHREGDYLFAHAGIRPGRPLADQSAHDLMWIREEFLSSDADHGAVVVHGHSIRAEPEIRRNRIGIDTGAYRSGCLTALALEATERRFLQT